MASSHPISQRHMTSTPFSTLSPALIAPPLAENGRWDSWITAPLLQQALQNIHLQQVWKDLTRCFVAYQKVIQLSQAQCEQLRSNNQIMRNIIEKTEELKEILQQNEQAQSLFTQEMKGQTAQVMWSHIQIKQDLPQLEAKVEEMQKIADFLEERSCMDAFDKEFTTACERQQLSFSESTQACEKINHQNESFLHSLALLKQVKKVQQQNLSENAEKNLLENVEDQNADFQCQNTVDSPSAAQEVETLVLPTPMLEDDSQRQVQEGLQKLQKEMEELQKILKERPKRILREKVVKKMDVKQENISKKSALKVIAFSQKPVFDFSVKISIHSLFYKIFFVSSNIMWRMVKSGFLENSRHDR